MTRLVAGVISLAVLMALAGCGGSRSVVRQAPPVPVPYAPDGAYLNFATKPPLTTSAQIRLGAQGVPIVLEPSGWEYNPVTIAQWGLQGDAVAKVRHRTRAVRDAITAADWLIQNQLRSGGWVYRFDYSPVGIDARLRAPWMSALAQGNAISLLTRVYRRTQRPKYLQSAERALLPLQRTVARGGLVAQLRHHPIYEEYPTRPPSFVLNGFMFTLVGLYDLMRTDPRSAATGLFKRGMRSLRASLRYYDVPGGPSAYHLGYLTERGQRVHRSVFYHRIHVLLLTALNDVDPAPELQRYLEKWRHYVPLPRDPP